MRKRVFLLGMGLTLSTALAAAAETYVIDSRHTFPSFEISHLDFSTQRGRFNQTTGQFVLDFERKTGSVDVTIAADSIDTGLLELEQELKKPDFFDTAQFASIRFLADSISFNGDQPSRVEGRITMRGITRPLTLSIDSFKCGINLVTRKYACGLNASGHLKRSDFGMTKFLPLLADDVKVLIQAEGFRQ